MAALDTQTLEFSKVLAQVRDNLIKISITTDQAAKSIGSALGQASDGVARLGKSAGVVRSSVEGLLGKITGLQNPFDIFFERYEKGVPNVSKIRKEIETLEKDMKAISSGPAGKNVDMSKMQAQLAALKDAEAAGIKLSSVIETAKTQYAELFSFAGSKFGLVFEAATLALAESLHISHQFNIDLQQSNSDINERSKLLKIGSRIMMDTGLSVKAVGSSMRALIEYGVEVDGNFKEVTETAGKLTTTLGVSSQHAAELALYAKLLGASYTGVVDNIVQVAEATGLSADEATRYSVELAKGFSLFSRSTSQGEFQKANKELLTFAGALKQVGGQASEVFKFVESIQSGANLAAAALLGITDLNISNKEQVKQATKGLAAYSDALSEQAIGSGIGARQTREAYASIFNVSVDFLVKAGDAYRKQTEIQTKYGSVLDKSNALAERYTNETANTGQVLAALKNVLLGLISGALLPVTKMITKLAEGVLDFITSIHKFVYLTPLITGLGVVLGGVLVVGLIQATAKLWAFARSLAAVVSAAHSNLPASTPGGAPGGSTAMKVLGVAASVAVGLYALQDATASVSERVTMFGVTALGAALQFPALTAAMGTFALTLWTAVAPVLAVVAVFVGVYVAARMIGASIMALVRGASVAEAAGKSFHESIYELGFMVGAVAGILYRIVNLIVDGIMQLPATIKFVLASVIDFVTKSIQRAEKSIGGFSETAANISNPQGYILKKILGSLVKSVLGTAASAVKTTVKESATEAVGSVATTSVEGKLVPAETIPTASVKIPTATPGEKEGDTKLADKLDELVAVNEKSNADAERRFQQKVALDSIRQAPTTESSDQPYYSAYA